MVNLNPIKEIQFWIPGDVSAWFELFPEWGDAKERRYVSAGSTGEPSKETKNHYLDVTCTMWKKLSQLRCVSADSTGEPSKETQEPILKCNTHRACQKNYHNYDVFQLIVLHHGNDPLFQSNVIYFQHNKFHASCNKINGQQQEGGGGLGLMYPPPKSSHLATTKTRFIAHA